MERKTLSQEFLEGKKLSLVDNLRINLLRRLSECDGMCDFYQTCRDCDTYKNNFNQNKFEYAPN